MTAAPYRSPVDLVNDQPLNQAAKRLLVRAGKKPDLEFLYCLQLMSAYLHAEPKEFPRDSYLELLTMVDNSLMFSDPPQQAMNYLLKSAEVEGDSLWLPDLAEFEAQDVDPLDLGRALCEALRTKMMAT